LDAGDTRGGLCVAVGRLAALERCSCRLRASWCRILELKGHSSTRRSWRPGRSRVHLLDFPAERSSCMRPGNGCGTCGHSAGHRASLGRCRDEEGRSHARAQGCADQGPQAAGRPGVPRQGAEASSPEITRRNCRRSPVFRRWGSDLAMRSLNRYGRRIV
jgi:hypothetical protein